MLQQNLTPGEFDGKKFGDRHGVTDFFIQGNTLHYPDSLGANAADPGPVDASNLDAPDSHPADPTKPQTAIDAVINDPSTATLQQVAEVLQYLLEHPAGQRHLK